MDVFAVGTGLGVPLRRVFHAVGHGLVDNTLVELAVLQFQEEAGHAPPLVGQVFDSQPLLFQRAEEGLGYL